MFKFGDSIILNNKISLRTRIRFFLFGIPDTGHFLRSKYFKKYLNIRPLREVLGRKNADTHILDAGCGNGEYSFYLAQRCPQALVDACDVDEKTITEDKKNQGKLRLDNISFFKSDLVSLGREAKYDFIVCIGVIIYMTSQINEKIFKNLYAALKEKGIMYLYLAHRDWEDSIMIAPRFYRKMYEEAKQQNRGDLYNQQTLSALLEKTGFKIIKQKITGGFWGELAWEIDQILKENNFTKIRILLMPFLKLLCLIDIQANYKKGTGMIFVVEKP